MTASLDAAYFNALYDSDPDPWRFASSPYEAEKYAATIAALTPRYGSAFEIGCSIGILTRQLAGFCDRLLSVDIAQKPLDAARLRCADLPQVSFARMQIPRDWPLGKFDLILLSEVVYYLDTADIDAAATATAGSLTPGGTVLLVHWLGPTSYPTGGDAAAERFIATAKLRLRHQSRTDKYRLDLLNA